MSLSRRAFLGGAAVAVAALGSPELAFAASSSSDPLLVVIQLGGGNDGLNTLVPFADPLYRKLRPKLALSENEVLPVANGIGLHGAMGKLHALFEQGRVAIVQGIGHAKITRSHFDATDVWQTARFPPRPDATGWLGRALEHQRYADPLAGIGVGAATASPSLHEKLGAPVALSSLDAFALADDPQFRQDGPAAMKALRACYAQAANRAPLGSIRAVGHHAFVAADLLTHSAHAYASEVAYPRGPLGDSLKLVAQVASAGLGLRLAHVTFGSFDTHAHQRGKHAGLLGQLSNGIAALGADAVQHGFADRLIVMTYSEFGRRVEENGTEGTDHGAAGVSFVVGNCVKGGVHGKAPPLESLTDGDLTVTTDFRSLYSSVLRKWAGRVVPGVLEPVPPLEVFV